jgi:hypothetical protein
VLPAVFCFHQQICAFVRFFILPIRAPNFFQKGRAAIQAAAKLAIGNIFYILLPVWHGGGGFLPQLSAAFAGVGFPSPEA